MTDHPISACMKVAEEARLRLARKGVIMDIYQKWNCEHCGTRQTMATKNVFFQSGICEECGKTSKIKKCNYLAHFYSSALSANKGAVDALDL